jgi:replicative DNA helicase
MSMQRFDLTDDFSDPAAERALIAAVAQQLELYWQVLDLLPTGAFVVEAAAWTTISRAIEAEQSPPVPDGWTPAADPKAVARHLADLWQRRLLAQAQERLAHALYDRSQPAAALATLLEEEMIRIQAAQRETQAMRLMWASELLPRMLQEAEDRWRVRQETGQPVRGLPTGIPRLNHLLGGWQAGVNILAGPPGVGKTTLAMQSAAAATAQVPVLYVTFENSPLNLILKAIAATAGVNPQHVQQGVADLDALRRAAEDWQSVAARLAFIEGSGRLTVAQVRAKALHALHRHRATQCLVVIDYLQLWAKAAQELRGLTSVRERVETLGADLRQLAMRLASPVLALASQNRAQGHYGEGGGAAALDSLKESGDLEYQADVVLFLTENRQRSAVPPARAVDLTLAKHRHGDIGKIELMFRPDLGTLREVART